MRLNINLLLLLILHRHLRLLHLNTFWGWNISALVHRLGTLSLVNLKHRLSRYFLRICSLSCWLLNSNTLILILLHVHKVCLLHRWLLFCLLCICTMRLICLYKTISTCWSISALLTFYIELLSCLICFHNGTKLLSS